MKHLKIDKDTRKKLIKLYEDRKISLEGNILKLIDADGDEEFEAYIEESIKRDKDNRRKRLEVTKKVQSQNTELTGLNKENNRVNRQLTKALEEAEQSKNDALRSRDEAEASKEEAIRLREQAEEARIEAVRAKDEAENAKKAAEEDLELLQKKKQFELIGKVVKMALFVIVGVGVVTTAMYVVAMYTGQDTSVIGSTWSNIVGILLTNAFSIVGTIMGVKYATSKNSSDE